MKRSISRMLTMTGNMVMAPIRAVFRKSRSVAPITCVRPKMQAYARVAIVEPSEFVARQRCHRPMGECRVQMKLHVSEFARSVPKEKKGADVTQPVEILRIRFHTLAVYIRNPRKPVHMAVRDPTRIQNDVDGNLNP